MWLWFAVYLQTRPDFHDDVEPNGKDVGNVEGSSLGLNSTRSTCLGERGKPQRNCVTIVSVGPRHAAGCLHLGEVPSSKDFSQNTVGAETRLLDVWTSDEVTSSNDQSKYCRSRNTAARCLDVRWSDVIEWPVKVLSEPKHGCETSGRQMKWRHRMTSQSIVGAETWLRDVWTSDEVTSSN
jgi:hypothetical protein